MLRCNAICARDQGPPTTNSFASGTNVQEGVLAALQQSLPCHALPTPCRQLAAPCRAALWFMVYCLVCVQEGGRALVNLLFGAQSPSGRLPITWYSNSYTAAVSPLNLNMRPDAKTGHPGRSYRWASLCVFVCACDPWGLCEKNEADEACWNVDSGDPAACCMQVQIPVCDPCLSACSAGFCRTTATSCTPLATASPSPPSATAA